MAFLWFPYAAMTDHWPDAKLGSVVALLAAAYVVGHILQSLALSVFPSKMAKNADGEAAYPSTVVMDGGQNSLHPAVAKRVQDGVMSWFGIDIEAGTKATKDISDKRQAAFFLCRPIVNARIAYAEQFQGLYTMMRGLTAACMLCTAYLVGWILTALKAACGQVIAEFSVGTILVIIAALALARVMPVGSKYRKEIDQAISAAVLLCFVCGGYLVESLVGSLNHNEVLVFLCGLTITFFAGLRFLALYNYFAFEFAKAVWSNFAVEPTIRPTTEVKKGVEASKSAEGEGDSE